MYRWLTLLWVMSWTALGVQAQTQITFSPASLELNVGEHAIVEVVVNEVPAPGLAAYQTALTFTPGTIEILNPNEDFRGTITPFAPLGGNPFCSIVRGTATCPDPLWFLTSTGRTADAVPDTIDNNAGKIEFGFGTRGDTAPPVGGGTIALIEVVGTADGNTTITLDDVILATNDEPPRELPFTAGSLSVRVGDVVDNTAPQLAAIGNQSVVEGASLSIPLSATDDDGNGLTFSTSGLPGFCSLTDGGDGTGSLDCDPGFDDANDYTVTVTVTDDGSPNLADDETFTLTVDDVPINTMPQLAAIGNQSVAEGGSLSIPLSAMDDDGNGLTFSTSVLPGFCSLTDGGAGAGSLDCAPGFEDANNYTVTVTVTDDGSPNLVDDETFTLTVTDVNQPPELAAIGNQSVDEGGNLSIPLSATDDDGNDLTFSTSGLPGFCSLTDGGAGSGSLDCDPGPNDANNYTVTVTVTDDGSPNLADDETFTLTVTDVNQPPALTAIENQSVAESESLSIPLSATDDDGNGLTFSTTDLPGFCSLTDGGDGSGSLDCAPGFDDAGNYTVTVTVTDDGSPNEADDETFELEVRDTNRRPVADAGNDTNVSTGAEVTLDGSNSSDPDEDQLLFSWRFETVPAGSALTDADLANADTPAPSFIPDVDGEYVLELEVSDDALSDAATVRITAATDNVPPNAVAGDDQDVSTLQPVTLDGTGSNDPDEGPQELSFNWSFDAVPAGSVLTDDQIVGRDTATPVFTPDVDGTYRLILEVSDGAETRQDTVDVRATTPNVPPTADAGADITDAQTGTPVALDGSSSFDPDNLPQPLSFEWSFVSVPPGSVLTDTDIADRLSATPMFTPDVDGMYLLRLDVSDGEDSDFDQVMVDASTPNTMPELAAIGDQSVAEGESLSIPLSATDDDGNDLTFSTSGLPGFCSLTDGGDGSGSLDCDPGLADADSYTVTVMVTDNGSPNLADEETFTLTVVDVNQTPELAAIGDQSVAEGDNLSIPLSATDDDGNGLTFSTSGLPGFCSLTDGGDGSGSLDCDPGFDDANDYTVTVTVTDNGSPNLADEETFTLTVVDVNLPPQLAAIGNQSVAEGESLSIPLSATDADGNGLTFSTSGLPGFCSLTDGGAGSGSLDCAPGFDAADNYTVTVTVTDNGIPNLADDETFTLTVVDVNQPPELAAIGNQSVDEGGNLSIPLSATDDDGNGLTFSTSGLPGFCSLTDGGAGSGSLDCDPGPNDANNYTVTVTVTDDGSPNLADDETFTLTVTDVNQPPALTAIENQSVAESESLSIPLSATDDDGNGLTFSTTDLPGFCSLTDGGDGSGSLDCAPGFDDAGNYTVTVTVTDDGSPNEADDETFELEVRDTNRRPVADAGNDTNVSTGAEVTLDGSNSSDPDEDQLLFSWRFETVPAGSALTDADLANADTPAPSFIPDVDGEYVLELEVSDDALSDAATVRITAATDNVPPNAVAGDDQDVSTLQPVTLDGTGSNDPDEGPQELSFNWSFDAVPAGSVLTDDQIVGRDTATPVFTPDVDGTYRLILEVSDGAETRQDTVDVRATTPNVPPTADAGADITDAQTGTPVALDGSSSFDPDNLPQPLSFEWSFVSVPPGSVLTDTDIADRLSATPMFTPDVDGMYLLRLDVSDGEDSDFDQVMVDASTPNTMPELAAIGDQSVAEGESLSIPLSATDDDGNDLTFSTSGLPGFCSLTDGGDGSGSLDCDPGLADADSYTVTVMVTDNGSPNLADEETFTLTVVDVNQTPELAAIGDQSVAEGDNLSIPLSATDDDGNDLTFSTSGLPGFCSLTDGGDGSGSLDCDPGFDDANNYTVTVTVTDNGSPNLADEETFTLTVVDVNLPPQLAAIGNQSVAEGESLSIPLSATDADGNGLTFSTSGLPGFCSLTDGGAGSGSLDCAPGFDAADNYTVTVTVTDNGSPNLADDETFTLTVTDLNARPPQLAAIGDQSMDEGGNLSIPLSATDDDGDGLTFSTSGQPGFCSLTDGGDGSGSLDCAPGFEDADSYLITVRVTDDGSPNLADEQTFDLEVRDTNRRPLADAGDDTNVPTGAQVTLDGSNSSDPDADLLLFSWRFDTVPTGSALTDADLSNAATPESGFTPDVEGEYVLELAVSDDALSDTATVRITASTDNVPPNAGAGNDQDVSTLQPVTLDGTGSDDPDQGPQDLSFNWFFAAVPAGSVLTDDQIVGSDTATPVFTPDVDGTYRLILEVSDGAETRQDTVDVRATTLNVPPTADAGADIAIAETDLPVVLNGSNSIDPDNLPQLLSFEWRFVFVPPGSALTDEDITDDLTATPSFTPDVDGLYLLRLDVSDGAERDFDQVMVEMGDVPDTPVGLFGRAKQSLVNLGWSGSEAATDFVIFRRLDSEIDFTEVGRVPVRVFVDELPVGTLSAEYFVVAENEFGASGDSDIVTVAPTVRGR